MDLIIHTPEFMLFESKDSLTLTQLKTGDSITAKSPESIEYVIGHIYDQSPILLEYVIDKICVENFFV